MEQADKEYRYKNLLVIGNGFDKDLGLPTTYKEFVDSDIFHSMYEKYSLENPNPSLMHYLYGRRFYDKWYDIELALLEYVSRRPDGSFVNNIEKDKKDYELLCSTFVEYLKKLFKGKEQKVIDEIKIMNESAAGKILNTIIRGEDNRIYSFNYTPIKLIINCLNLNSRLSNNEPIRLHGAIKEDSIWNERIKDNSIILGIETDDISNIAPGYSFLMKSNRPDYKSTNIARDLLASKHVIIFGHSLNKMDSGYFEEYFDYLTTNSNEDKKLTIITKDNDSRQTLLDNLRRMNISVLKMFAHANVEFILTSNMKDKESDDTLRFNELINN